MAEMSQTEPGKTWNPVSTIKSSILSPTVDGSPSTSGLGQLETKVAQELSHGSQKVTDGAIANSGSNSNTERKSRRSSGKATVKASSKRRNPVKETASVRLERGGKMTNVSLSPPGIFRPVQLNEMQCFGHVNSSAVKPLVLAASTSSLPDLNFSASSSAMFQQPFTDLQQVQLRAQIFVYGALIQGTVPDEAYMISAFGGPDGRSMWENAWRSCIERLHGLKSHLVAPEIHLLSDSGSRVPEQATKQSALRSKEISPSIGRVSSKGIPTILNPVVPLSSPLWSLPMPSADALQSSGLPRGPPMDYQRALSPLPSHQTPPARSSVAPNPSWISQAPFCGPWVASPQNSVLDASGHFSVQLPTTETVQVTPVKESSLPDSSGVKHVLSGTGLRTGASSGVFTGISLGPDVRKVTEVSEQHSSVPKPRKRKKISVPESSGQNALLPQSHAEVGSASAVGSHLSTHLSTFVASTTPVTSVSKASTDKFISSLSAISGHIRKGDQNTEGRATATEQTLTKVKEARVQAEDAAAFAASAVSHSQEIWSQLDKQRKSGLQLDIETKLTSAAAAIAATAAIAKAAASAASVASNAALQAKLMADEAVLSSGFNITGQSYSISFSEGTHNLEKATPASILKSDDGTNNSSSILHAAREAARRRVEAASAASKHAENMVAIVKAAELAADTVSQAGKVVAMANHLPSNEIVAAAPECHPKVTHVTSELFSKSNDVRENRNIDGAGQGLDISSRQDSLNKKELHSTNFARSPRKDESCEDDMRLVDVISGSGMTSAKDARVQKSRKASDLTKTVGLFPEPENDLRPSSLQNEHGKAEKTLKENNIKEASHVEVFKNGNDIKSAWFSANVLSVKDGKAYVAYDEITTGKGKLCFKNGMDADVNEIRRLGKYLHSL
uniref:G2484-1 protein n=1 Tax=Rhizophora mucronata TaxID=61149 RepID=A0A2P2M6Y4_RHIMU